MLLDARRLRYTGEPPANVCTCDENTAGEHECSCSHVFARVPTVFQILNIAPLQVQLEALFLHQYCKRTKGDTLT